MSPRPASARPGSSRIKSERRPRPAEIEPPKKVFAREIQRIEVPPLVSGLRPLPEGGFVLACREGFEEDLAEELIRLGPRGQAAPRLRMLVPGLLYSDKAVPRPQGRMDLTFARQAFPLHATLAGDDRLAKRVASEMMERAPRSGPISCQWFVPDSDQGNRLSQRAAILGAEVERVLERTVGERLFRGDPRRAGGYLAQLCLPEEHLVLVGGLATKSRWRGKTPVAAITWRLTDRYWA